MTTKGIVLEMTDPTQLRPSRRQPILSLTNIPASDGGRMANLYRKIWEPIGESGRSRWTDDQWINELNQQGMSAWVAQIADEDVGMAQLGWSGKGDAAFIVIGVVPDQQGKGAGGDLLTRLTEIMWQSPAPNGHRTQRVWLWTIPEEHPHTIPNYLARGFTRGPDLD